MINEYFVKKYCNEDISRIENYDKAISDKEQIWECHHRRELETSRKQLIKIGEYYNRPASELIFLTNSEHGSLHKKGKHHADETKRKISETLKGHKISEETKRKLAEARKGMKLSEEWKRKMSIAHQGKTTWIKGKHMSEEAKQKISIALQGKTTWIKGKHHTEETKRKISIAKKNMSEETKRKMSEAQKGKHHTEEHKRKVSEALKGKSLGLRWFNNGIKNVRAKSCPEGFVKGRINLKKYE